MTGKRAMKSVVAAVMFLGVSAFAQQQPAAPGGPGGPPDQAQQGGRGRGGWRNRDPQQFHQMMMDRIKQEIGASDDEWKAIQPRVEKVMALQRETRPMGMFGRGPRGPGANGPQGRPNPFGDQADSAVAKASQDLRSALDDKSISADEIAKRLATLRQAREQAKQDLTKAQADLKELLSQRQEAALVMNGMLD